MIQQHKQPQPTRNTRLFAFLRRLLASHSLPPATVPPLRRTLQVAQDSIRLADLTCELHDRGTDTR